MECTYRIQWHIPDSGHEWATYIEIDEHTRVNPMSEFRRVSHREPRRDWRLVRYTPTVVEYVTKEV